MKNRLEMEKHSHTAEPHPSHAIPQRNIIYAINSMGLGGGQSHQSFVTSLDTNMWLVLALG
mgnify:CR=1 FL=1